MAGRKKVTKRKKSESTYTYLRLGLIIKNTGLGQWDIKATQLEEAKDMTLKQIKKSIKDFKDKE